ncbi:3-ketosteroid-9-alpha-monooxygenase oxygenase subunit (plasmid) [Streptomyces sp. YIM 121038]|uniref:Rieske 2Fe-2S domain-containing protein n=1 Tax=Streptomyces sp. YIM 121038 TaxID=2136401 RepID=UPI001165B9BD|nr:Rieske 2Fe-2S domain-containing protein [Streptomyces sp. YIM 121038]QCX82932.1 3-ketosteroid-9-alpha-monooxygenase oxygenase subunit [Streptomyces sp. YIM 121038]
MASQWKKRLVKQERPAFAYESGPVPLPYPQGWFMLAPSAEVPPGSVVTRRFMGEDVVVYRTRSGRLRVVRPYCPHLGAHLGCGWVDGEEIVCPFHHFAFGPDGNNVRVGPGYDVPLIQRRVSTLHSEEMNGGIFAWSGQGGETPSWRLPQLPGQASRAPLFKTFDLHTHPQEVCENIFDAGHTRAVHGYADCFMRRPPVADKHEYSAALRFSRPFPPFGVLESDLDISLHGLGFFEATFHVPKIGLKMVVMASPRPVEPWRVHLALGVSSVSLDPGFGWRRRLPEKLVAWFSRTITPMNMRMLMADAAPDHGIWDRKHYTSPPALVREEGPIGSYRKWCQQFYAPDRGAVADADAGSAT